MSEIQYRVCATGDVGPNSVQRFEIDGHGIAIYNIDGTFYASDDTCTHGLSRLSEGELDGDIIECSLHFGAFHVPSGKPVGAPCSVPLTVYRVEVVDDAVTMYRAAGSATDGKPQWQPIRIV